MALTGLVRVLLWCLVPAADREAFGGDLVEAGAPLRELVRSAPSLLRLRLRRGVQRRLPTLVGGAAGLTVWLFAAEGVRRYVLSQVPLRAGPAPSAGYLIASGAIGFGFGALGGWLVRRALTGEINR